MRARRTLLAQQAPPQRARPAAKPAPKPQVRSHNSSRPNSSNNEAAPPPEQQQQQAAEPQLIFSPWVKLCNKDADPKAKRVCVTVKDGRVEFGLLVVSVAIIEMDGEQRKLLRMSLRMAWRYSTARG